MLADRAVAADEFGQRVRDFINTVDYRLAVTQEDRLDIYRLRYRSYVREGTIAPNRQELFKDDLDDVPNVWIFGCFVDGRLVSSVRVHVASPAHPVAPATAVFSDVLAPEVETGKVLVDPTRFVTDQQYARDMPYLPYATVRIPFLACEHFDADIGVAAVRTEHRAFYKRLFMMNQVGEPRTYPSLTKPIALMVFDYGDVRSRVIARHPFMASTAAERQRMFGTAPARKLPYLLSGARNAAHLAARGEALASARAG